MKKALLIGIIAAAIIVPMVAYAVAPYFTESSIDEDLPSNVLFPPTDEGTIGGGMMDDEGMMEDDMMDETMMDEDMLEQAGTMNDDLLEEGMMDDTMMDEEMMDDVGTTNDGMDVGDAHDEPAIGEDVSVDTQAQTEAVPVTYSGTFIGVDDGIHHAEGTALVLPLDDGSQILRLEDFYSTNGPDVYVYMSTDKQASDFVSLGKIKANAGNQNYVIPDGTDLEKYDKVLIWCQAFSVLFGSSEITQDV